MFRIKKIQFLLQNWYQKLFPVLDPFHQLMIYWQILVFAYIFIYQLVVPLRLSFSLPRNSFRIADITILVAYSVEMLINFQTAVYQEGIIVKQRRLIASRYLSGNFKIDLVAQIGVLLSLLSSWQVMLLLSLLKLYKLPQLFVDIDNHFQF